MDFSVRNIFCVDKTTFLLTTDNRLFFSGSFAGSSEIENINSFKEIESMRGIKIKTMVNMPIHSDNYLIFALTYSGEVFMWGVDKFNLVGGEALSCDKAVIKTPVINKDLLDKHVIDIYSDNYNVYFKTKDDKLLTYNFFSYYWGEKEYENHSLQEIKTPKMDIKKIIYVDYLAFIVTSDGELYQCRKKDKFQTDSYIGYGGRYYGREYYDRPIICNEVEKIDLKGLKIISIGENFSYVLLSDGNIYNIVVNKYNNSLSLSEPYKSVSCFNNPEIITSSDHEKTAFFLTDERKIYGIGNNEVGQLGIGTTFEDSNKAYLIEKLSNEIIASLSFVSRKNHGKLDSLYAITTDGKLYAWGCNYNSCLGLGTVQKVYKKPTLVNSFNNNSIDKVVINEWSNFYIMKNGNIYVSGDNTAGQLGIGDFSERTKPTLLKGFKYATNNNGELDKNCSISLEEKIITEEKDILKRYKELIALIKTNPEYADRIRKIGIEIARLTVELPAGYNNELIQALLSLGFSKEDALLTSSKIDKEKGIEEQIFDALNLIGKLKNKIII